MKASVYVALLFTLLISIGFVSATTCTDSDNGINLNTAGYVTGSFTGGGQYTTYDFCSITDPAKVSEQYCVNPDTGEIGGNYPNSIWQTCPSGYICVDGACAYASTTCSQEGGTCRDICNEEEGNIGILDCTGGDNCCKVGEHISDCPPGTEDYYCSESSPGYRFKCVNGNTYQYSCGSGYVCSVGQCVLEGGGGGRGTEPICTDSDNGDNKDVYGTVSGFYSNGQSFFINDFCSITDPAKISEAICVGNDPSANWEYCPAGSRCIDGQCDTDLSSTCSQEGGTCREFCKIGEIAIGEGFSDCDLNSCCKKGEITGCPSGSEVPSCIDGDNTKFQVCRGGINYISSCIEPFKCTDGLLCYGLTNDAGLDLSNFGDGIKDTIKTITGIINGNCSSTCTDWALTKVGLKKCEPSLFDKLTFGFFDSLGCSLYFIKVIVLLSATVIFYLGISRWLKVKYRGSSKKAFRTIISLLASLALFSLLYLLLLTVLFWVIVAGIILYFLVKGGLLRKWTKKG